MEKRNFWLAMLKGLLVGVIISLVAVLLFALILRFVSMSDGVIKIVNQVIKVLAIFSAVLFAVRGKMCYLQGGVLGIFVSIITYIIFGIISADLSFGLSFLYETIFAFVFGLLSGVIAGCLKREDAEAQ